MKMQLVSTLLLLSSPALAQPFTGPAGLASAGVRGAVDGAPVDEALPIDVSLAAAYKREFAFLAGQKKQLELRLGRVESQAAADVKRLHSEITGLESRLLAREASAKALREELVRAEQGQQSTADDQQLVEVTLEQSGATLKDNDLPAPEVTPESDKAKLLEQRFDAALTLLDRVSSVQTEDGSFFRADGTRTDGKIVRLGRVAAYGVGPDAAGVLAPAGGAKLKIWREPATQKVRGLIGGERPALLPVFLYESLDAAVDDSAGETALEHVDSGGAIAWVIVGLGVLGVLLVLGRAALLSSAKSDTDGLTAKIAGMVRQDQFDSAAELSRATRGSAGRVVASVLTALGQGVEDVEDVVSESMLGESRRLHRFGTLILVIAAVAPLLGLLGTVTGMISTFDIITKFGTGDPGMLSSGISEALVTTQLGLAVAIPSLLLGNLLADRASNLMESMDRGALELANLRVPGPRDGDGVEEPEEEEPPDESGAEPSALEAVATHA